jgi:cbb3-type cytochrome c oxidase subunit III
MAGSCAARNALTIAGRGTDLRTALAALAVATAVLAAGCGAVGRSTDGDASSGKLLFSKSPGPGKPSCASCHTLADAKAQGTLGPNLDDAFESSKAQGFDLSTIRDVIRGQIAYAEEPMPTNLYEGQDADDVAAYIAKCAAVASCGVTAAQPEGAKPSGGGGAADGKQVFSDNCSSCHTLKDAGATGTVGPNLDDLKPPKETVKRQVENGGGAMPAFKGTLSPAEIDAVAAYVARVAGK